MKSKRLLQAALQSLAKKQGADHCCPHNDQHGSTSGARKWEDKDAHDRDGPFAH